MAIRMPIAKHFESRQKQGPNAVRQYARESTRDNENGWDKPERKTSTLPPLNSQVEAKERAIKWLCDERLVAKTAKFRFLQADWDGSGSVDTDQVAGMFTSLIASSGLQGVVNVPSQREWEIHINLRVPGKMSLEEWTEFFKKYMTAQLTREELERRTGLARRDLETVAAMKARLEILEQENKSLKRQQKKQSWDRGPVTMSPVSQELEEKKDLQREKMALADVQCMVLDNTLRETTVGSIRGHTLETKLKLLDKLAETGIKVEDQMAARYLKLKGNMDFAWGFSEGWENGADGLPGVDPPAGVLDMLKHKMSNFVLEVDFCTPGMKYDQFDVGAVVARQCKWAMENANPRCGGREKPRVMVNLRDFANFPLSSDGYSSALRLVETLGKMDPAVRPVGLLIEEPTGFMIPEEVGYYTQTLRDTMIKVGWPNGRLLVHVHAGFGLAEASVLEALARGGDGIWCAVCRPGALEGHANSATTLCNLARLGNKYVKRTYDLKKIVKAARYAHELVTREQVHPNEEVYGERAFDNAFGGWHGFQHGKMDEVAKMLGATRRVRVTDFANAKMLQKAMEERFGPATVAGWDSKICLAMEKTIDAKLLNGQSQDADSPLGLAFLYEEAGGRMTVPMLRVAVGNRCVPDEHPVLTELRRRWDRLVKAGSAQKNITVAGTLAHAAAVPRPSDMQAMDYALFRSAVLEPFKFDKKTADAVLRDLDVDSNKKIGWVEFSLVLEFTIADKGMLYYATPEDLLADALKVNNKAYWDRE